ALEILDMKVPTRLNGTIISQGQRVKDRDEISVGRYVLKLYLTMDGRQASTPPGSGVLRTHSAESREYTLPTGSAVRTHGGTLKLPVERRRESAALSSELAAIGQVEPLADRILHQILATFRAASAGICIRLRTAAGLEVVRAMDAKGRPIDAPSLMTRLHERCARYSNEICIPDA